MPQPSVPRFDPKTLLVPIDFSPSSEAAFETATDLALHFHAQLCLLHVVPMLPVYAGSEFYSGTYSASEEEFLRGAKANAVQQLASFTAALLAKGLQSKSLVEVGEDVAGAIDRTVEREHIEMVVISTHGMSGWRPLVFGSTAEKVVRLVQCPILLLRSVGAATTS